MYANGHIGLTLLILSGLLVPFGANPYALPLLVVAAGFSTWPDIDMKFEIVHRKFTHNLLFGVVCGTLIGALAVAVDNVIMGATFFAGVFAGCALHLVGDVIAGRKKDGSPWPLRPFVPFSQREIGYGWFKASDKKMNNGFLYLGLLALVLLVLVQNGVF